jgi:hypothetical protein
MVSPRRALASASTSRARNEPGAGSRRLKKRSAFAAQSPGTGDGTVLDFVLKTHQREAAIKAPQMDAPVQCTVLAEIPATRPSPDPPYQLLALHQLSQRTQVLRDRHESALREDDEPSDSTGRLRLAAAPRLSSTTFTTQTSAPTTSSTTRTATGSTSDRRGGLPPAPPWDLICAHSCCI